MTEHYKQLSSAHNDELKQLARWMQQGRARRDAGVMILEGIHLLEAALDAGTVPESVHVNESALARDEVVALLRRVPASCVRVLSGAALGRLTALSTAPELLAVCPRPRPAFAANAACVLLDDVQDPGNVGTILRSAAAAGVQDVHLSAGCADVFGPKVLRAGMGAHFALRIHESADLADVIAHHGGPCIATALDGSVSLYSVDLTGPVVLVFGNEGAGVSGALLSLADTRVRIPMPGVAESLNVAMAATICLFERVRQCEA